RRGENRRAGEESGELGFWLGMTAAQRAQIQKLLLELARDLAKRAAQKIEPNRQSEAEVGGDQDEQPLNEMLQSIALNRNKTDAAISRRVDRAIARLRDEPESFGECEVCGEEIGLPRLRAMPFGEVRVA